MRKAKVITGLALAVVMLVAMAGIAVANPGGAASPSEVNMNIQTNDPVDIEFKWWDTTGAVTNQTRFYIWKDNNRDGVADDLDNSGFYGDAGDICYEVDIRWNSTDSWTPGFLTVNIPPDNFDNIEPGQPESTETRYTKTIQIRDADSGATVNDYYIIQGSLGASYAISHMVSTDTDINPIPEFATIAIPVASILGLLFFFNHRKRKKE